MIKINKNSRFSFTIYLSEKDVILFLEYLNCNSQDSLELSEGSFGFKNKEINTLKISQSDKSYLKQSQSNLFLQLDSDDFDYLIFKLNDRLICDDFIPSELFTINWINNKSIDFYLSDNL